MAAMDPSKVVARATVATRGERTGIMFGKRGTVPVDEKTGLEDMNAFWSTANTPSSVKTKTPPKKTPLKNTNKIQPRFSVGRSSSEKPGKVNKYLTRFGSNKETSWSPSDLSRVSAAPTPEVPSPEGVRASKQSEDDRVDLPSQDEAAAVVTEEPEFDHMEDGAPVEEDDLIPPLPPEEAMEEAQQKDEKMEEVAPQPSPDTGLDIPLDGDDDEHDNDGSGFNIVHDPETPESVREERIRREQSEAEKKRKKAKEKARRKSTSTTKSNASATTPKRPAKRRSKKKTTNPFSSPQGIQAGNREYQLVPVSEYKEDSAPPGLRRSKRARFPPLAFWKNEALEYEPHQETGELGKAMGQMGVVKGVMMALPTPYKKRKAPAKTGSATKTKKNTKANKETDAPFNDSRLRKKYDFVEGDHAKMWDEVKEEPEHTKVVAFARELDLRPMAIPERCVRTKAEGNVSFLAAQSFNVETDAKDIYRGYIMGQVTLPPKGIKDEESVGGCAQVFTVVRCQANALEVAYSDPEEPEGSFHHDTAQRFLLGPGDMFRIPPGNAYRLRNHSKTEDSILTWTIVRPL